MDYQPAEFDDCRRGLDNWPLVCYSICTMEVMPVYKVGDLVRFSGDYEGSLDEGYPIGVIIKALSSPRDDGCSAEVKWVTGGRYWCEPVTNLKSFFIRDGDMEVISDVR